MFFLERRTLKPYDGSRENINIKYSCDVIQFVRFGCSSVGTIGINLHQ